MSSEITPRTITVTAPALTREDLAGSTDPAALSRSILDREEVFDEVIYTLGILHQASTAIDFPHTRGVLFALEAVKAMKEAEL